MEWQESAGASLGQGQVVEIRVRTLWGAGGRSREAWHGRRLGA